MRHSPHNNFAAQHEPVDERANTRPLAHLAIYLVLASMLIAVAIVSVCVGQYRISPEKVLAIIAGQFTGGEAGWTTMDERIVLLVRGPRIVLVILCGAALSMAGAAMQGVFRNPLAAPELLGVSSGAAFGGALAILVGAPATVLLAGSFSTGLLALLLVCAIARIGGRSDTTGVILAGVIVGAFFAALVSVTQFFADPHQSLPAIVFWLMGSFATADWRQISIAAPGIVVGGGVLFMMRFRINVLSLGDEEARALGIAVERDRWLIFMAVALISGAVVSVAGIVGWVGLVVPHLARLLVGPDNRHLLPASCLLGATYLTLIDTLARSATSVEIPLGVLTAIIGAPFVAILLRHTRRTAEEAQ